MREEADSEQNRAVGLTPEPTSLMPWRVVSVAPMPGYRLLVCFVDGLSGAVDLSALVASPDAGVFTGLRDADLFDKVHVAFGAVTWPGDIDLAPDAMYEAIRRFGEWRPE